METNANCYSTVACRRRERFPKETLTLSLNWLIIRYILEGFFISFDCRVLKLSDFNKIKRIDNKRCTSDCVKLVVFNPTSSSATRECDGSGFSRLRGVLVLNIGSTVFNTGFLGDLKLQNLFVGCKFFKRKCLICIWFINLRLFKW